MEDGSHAVGFCNLGLERVTLSYKDFDKLGIYGKQQVRDLWRQKNIARIDGNNKELAITVPAHGVLLYKFSGLDKKLIKEK
jgi:alpha-galactosidase